MFDAPEATGGDSTFLGCVGDVLGAALRSETHLGGGGEGAEEARDEIGHQACHYQDEDGENEGLRGELQLEGVGS